MAQVKFIVDEELLKKFKQVVIKKRGKIDLTPEGEEALRLYIQKYGDAEGGPSDGEDPLMQAVGAVRTGRRRSALKDLRRMEAEP